MKIGTKEAIDNIKNLAAFAMCRTITFQEYLQRECTEIFGDENRWWTGENLKHTPTDMELQSNYLNHGGDEKFRKKNRYLVERPWQRKVRETLSFLRDAIAVLLRQINYRKWASD